MPTLQNRINSINFSTQLTEVKGLLDKAHTRTTFWGSRVVEIDGFSGSVYLADIAKKMVLECADRSTRERIAGIDITRKLDEFYRETDGQIAGSNFLTRFFSCIQKYLSPAIWKNMRETDKLFPFVSYTEAGINAAFGDKSRFFGDSKGPFTASEKAIRSLLDKEQPADVQHVFR